MDCYHVDFALQAKEHLQSIYNYIKNELCNPVSARRIVSLIKEEIISLKTMPERIQLVNEEPWSSLGVRRDRVKNYYIYYLVDSENKVVHVVGIIYARRDQSRQLKELKLK